MAVRIRRWFGVPPELFETGIIKKMSASDHLLYTYLCWHSDRHSSRQFRVVAKEVAKSTEMSLRSISTARSHLCKLGLVCCDKLPDGTFTYTLCDVRTRKPYPGAPREKINYTPKAKVSAPSKVRKGKSSGSRDSMLQKQTTTQTRPSSLVTTRSTVSSQWTSRTSGDLANGITESKHKCWLPFFSPDEFRELGHCLWFLIAEPLVVYQLNRLIDWSSGKMARRRQQMSTLPDAPYTQALLTIIAVVNRDNSKKGCGMRQVRIGHPPQQFMSECESQTPGRREFYDCRRQGRLSKFIQNQTVTEFLDIAPLPAYPALAPLLHLRVRIHDVVGFGDHVHDVATVFVRGERENFDIRLLPRKLANPLDKI